MTRTSNANYVIFHDCFSSSILQKISVAEQKAAKRRSGKGRKKDIKPAVDKSPANDNDNGEELEDFVEYLASEVFAVLPIDLRELSYSLVQSDPRVASKYTDPLSSRVAAPGLLNIPPTVLDSVEAYALLPDSTDLSSLVSSVIIEYISVIAAPPPVWTDTRVSACEMCDRDWIPLTYHHLIPKQIHAKALKRHWHEEWTLNSVAWLCRACHSFVHRIASNEQLAKDLWSVELLMAREDVQAWAKWVGRVRWKSK